jgi:hypothetical protein
MKREPARTEAERLEAVDRYDRGEATCPYCGGDHAEHGEMRRCSDEWQAAMSDQDRLRRTKEAEAFVGVLTDKIEEGLAFDQTMADAFPEEDR